MSDKNLDRILGGETGIVASSGFTASVMDAVRREASAPPPIPFPWTRALPGLVAWGLMLAAIIVVIVRSGPGTPSPAAEPGWLSTLTPVLDAAKMYGAMYGVGWIVLALLLAWASVKLSMRVAAGGRR